MIQVFKSIEQIDSIPKNQPFTLVDESFKSALNAVWKDHRLKFDMLGLHKRSCLVEDDLVPVSLPVIYFKCALVSFSVSLYLSL